jgi:transposase-like protein
MADDPVTIGAADLQELLQGDDGVKILGEKGFNQGLQAPAADLRRPPYERTADRPGDRNETRARTRTTRVGTLTLQIPHRREGHASPPAWPAPNAVSPRWR